MKAEVYNMKVEITLENGDDLGEGITFRGPPTKITKHLAKHEWKKLMDDCEFSHAEIVGQPS